ncbi:MAG: hypothetical protein K6U74_15930, partial [Firmicutes bacterium]|nr:hypothetical protein [Bacillota bacterium]
MKGRIMRLKGIVSLLIILVLGFPLPLFGAKKYENYVAALDPPTVSTSGASDIGESNAILTGSIDKNGGSYITEYGFCWGKNANNPENKVVVGYGHHMRSFSASLGNLSPGTTYYYYAYAKSNNGTLTGRGSLQSFTTKQAVNPPTVSTFGASDIGESNAILTGSIDKNGGSYITE